MNINKLLIITSLVLTYLKILTLVSLSLYIWFKFFNIWLKDIVIYLTHKCVHKLYLNNQKLLYYRDIIR